MVFGDRKYFYKNVWYCMKVCVYVNWENNVNC